MKATILLAVCILCAESKLELETSSPALALHSLFSSAFRHKRQAQEMQVDVCSIEEIFLRQYAVICDPSYATGQIMVDSSLGCNDGLDAARRDVGLCSRNKNGQFCYHFDLRRQQFYNYARNVSLNCPSLSSYSNYECTDLCRVSLQNLSSNLGCCLNSIYNISTSNYWTNGDLWAACSVNSPDFCRNSTLTLTLRNVTANRNCSEIYSHMPLYCNAQYFKPLLDIYKQCRNPVYEMFTILCGLNENNQLCVQFQNSSLQLVTIQSQCHDYVHGCTHSCHTAINTFKTTLGCCVNIYNASQYNYEYYNITIREYNGTDPTDPDLWSACGIPTPGFCPSTLLSDLPSTTRVPTLSISSPPTSSSEFNSAVSLDFPNIIMILTALLSIHM